MWILTCINADNSVYSYLFHSEDKAIEYKENMSKFLNCKLDIKPINFED